MSYHILDITGCNCRISCRNRQLVCTESDGSTRTVPMEDVSAVLINSFSCLLHNSFLTEAGKERIPVVLCEKFRPVSIVLPIQRGTDTLLTRTQITAPKKLLYDLWERTVSAKCVNQLSLASSIAPEHRLIDPMKSASGLRTIRKEGVCARHYWDVFSSSLDLGGFTRCREEVGLNSLLNYGYAVLLIRVLQRLLANGLDPMYGIGHFVRERSVPLAYDLMEPFRILVDQMIFEWCAGCRRTEEPPVVTAAYKKHIHAFCETKIQFQGRTLLPAGTVLDFIIRSFKQALVEQSAARYKPWTRRNSKWDGWSFVSTSRS